MRSVGAATVLALALVHLLLLLGMVGAVIGSTAVAHARAAAVADLAALAAAQSYGDPCSGARTVAEANGMAAVSCTTDGSDIVVEIATEVPGVVARWLAVLGRDAASVRAVARAGMP